MWYLNLKEKHNNRLLNYWYSTRTDICFSEKQAFFPVQKINYHFKLLYNSIAGKILNYCFSASLVILFILVLPSCNFHQSVYHQKLSRIDSMLIDNQIANIEDSLSAINPNLLNESNLSYFKLLKAISDLDKRKNIISDSLYLKLAKYYHTQKPSNNAIRAQLYLGIARYRLQMPDSLVYEPLKEAESLMMANLDIVNSATEFAIYKYLGKINERQNNYEQANNYYEQAKNLSIEVKSIDYLVTSSLLLFWNHLRYKRYDEARYIITNTDTIKANKIKINQLFSLKNAKAAFYYTQQQFDSALYVYNELEKNAHEIDGLVRMSNIFYSKSLAFNNLNRTDSALYYAQKAVENITDSSGMRQSYYLYSYLANLAYKNEDFKLSSESYNTAYQQLHEATDEMTKKRILELEKKYDYSRIELAAFKQKQNAQLMILSISFVVLILSLTVIIYKQQLRQNKIQLEKETLLRESAELKAAQSEFEKNQKEQLIMLYHHLVQRHAITEERFEQLSYRFIKDYPAIHDDIHAELNDLKVELNNMLSGLIHDDLFYSLLPIPKTIPLTNGEKMILFLLFCQTSNRQLATILGITAGNLRVRKSNLRRKLSNHLEDIPKIDEIMALF